MAPRGRQCQPLWRHRFRSILGRADYGSRLLWRRGSPLYAELIQATDLLFYGTTSTGTVYQLDPSGTLTVLHSPDGDEATPSGKILTALVQAADGSFYGATNAWQWYSNPPVHPGIVFRLDSTGAFATVHTFSCLEGGHPAGTGWPVEVPLTQAVDGSIYGTTETGGANDRGTIFRLDASSGKLDTLHIFDVVNGLLPGRLIQATDGAFYGSAGGVGYGLSNYDGGIVFRMTSAGEFTTFHGFSATDGGWAPEGQLIQAADGMFYGTAYIQSAAMRSIPGRRRHHRPPIGWRRQSHIPLQLP